MINKKQVMKHCGMVILFSSISFLSFAQVNPLVVTPSVGNTEAVKKADPKAGFKNLFENTTANTSTKNISLKGISIEHLNPQAISFVQDYMERHADHLKELQTWGKPYFDMMDDVLTQAEIPKQLKYLAVIESNLRASAVSWAGAVGPWQFMPGTATQLGLRVGRGVDERRDYLKSTRAAGKYLNYLYEIYEDWLLVVAAYNCGPGRVNSAIAKAGSSDFWKLQYYLPTESRNHVKKFIATHYIMEGEGGVTTVSKAQAIAMMATIKDEITHQDLKVQTISGRYNSKAIIKYLEMSIEDFGKLNPNMDKVLASNSTYQLKLPVEKMETFLSRKNEMLNESIQMLINPEYRN